MKNYIERLERVYPLNRSASDAARSGEPTRGESVLAWILLSPVVLPVIIWDGLIYPYLVPKTLLFYVLSFIAVGAFALLATHGRAFFWSRLSKWEAWIPAALTALAYGTSLVGIDFYRSFWSLFVRGDGLLMLTCATASFYLILISADRAFFERFIRAVAVVGSLVAVYGIGEWLVGGGRIGGLLGNAAFFAGYLGVAAFATLAAATTLRGSYRSAAYTGAALQVLAITLSATRGTMLALVLAGIAYLAYLAMRGEGALRTRSAWVLGALIVCGGLFIAFRSELAKFPFEPVARIASIGTHDPDVASRLFIWQNMVTEIGKSPWTGVGAEHIDALFNRFYDPTQISEQWFDRSHNAFLDYAAQYGIGGLVLYLALILACFSAALRLARRGEERVAGLFALLALTYAAQNFFVFDTVSSFWLLLALLAVFLSVSLADDAREVLPLSPMMRYASWPFALVLLLLLIPVSVQPALAASGLIEAYKYQLVDVPKEVSYFSHGFSLGTYADIEYGYEAYDMYVTQSTGLKGPARVAAYQAALAVLKQDFERYPYDARIALYLAHVLSLAPTGVSVDQNLLGSALERTIRLSPKRYQPWYILTNLALEGANANPVGSTARAAGYAAAHDLLSRYIALVPALSEPYFVLAQLERASGNMQAAAEDAAKGKQYYTSDLETAKRGAGYYEDVNDWKGAQFFLQEIVAMSPADTASRYDLAKVMYLGGDPAGADTIVARLRASAPSILTTDQNFLNAITAYEQSKK